MAAGLALLALTTAPLSRAAEYESDIAVERESELYDLAADGSISDETLVTLVELMQTGVDLGLASADEIYALPGLSRADAEHIVAYRERVGGIAEPAELVQAQVLSQAQLIRVTPFLSERATGEAKTPAPRRAPPPSGRLRLRGYGMLGDPVPPPLLLGARLRALGQLSAGVAIVSTRLKVGAARYDPVLGALVAEPARTRLELPKLFVAWTGRRETFVAGTFRIGFAERLTLDNTHRPRPDGIYPDDTLRAPGEPVGLCRYSTAGGAEPVCAERGIVSRRVTADFDFDPGFRGLAAGIRALELAPGLRVSLHAFGSYQPRSVYQYEIYDRRACANPRDTAASCSAPAVFEDPEGQRRLAFVSLPDAYRELAGGGRLALEIDSVELGATGYYAAPLWRVRGAALDFQEWSATPFGGPFGAFGVDGALRLAPLSLSFEAARSFDRTPERGGIGVVQRSLLSRANSELELVLRYYARDFNNPHARPPAAPDEFEGLRARNELGARLRYFAAPSEVVALRASGDVWTLPSNAGSTGRAGTTHLDLYARGDFTPSGPFGLASWVEYVNKDLRHNGPGLCYDRVATEVAAESLADDSSCHGEKLSVSARVSARLIDRALEIAAQYAHVWLTDPRYPRRLRQDMSAGVELAARPLQALALGARARYRDQALFDDGYLERAFSAAFEARAAPGRAFSARARYGFQVYLDRRSATLTREPNPEHRLQGELELRF